MTLKTVRIISPTPGSAPARNGVQGDRRELGCGPRAGLVTEPLVIDSSGRSPIISSAEQCGDCGGRRTVGVHARGTDSRAHPPGDW